MEQLEFFDNVKTKKMKEATVTLDCGCLLLYSAVTKEVFVNTCSTHTEVV
jgi:hypothetical protein